MIFSQKFKEPANHWLELPVPVTKNWIRIGSDFWNRFYNRNPNQKWGSLVLFMCGNRTRMEFFEDI
jgi:hypothetical protein